MTVYPLAHTVQKPFVLCLGDAPGGMGPFPVDAWWTAGLGRLCSEFPLFSTAMLLLSGALVSGPYALITTAVSADLVSHTRLPPTPGPALPQPVKRHSQFVQREPVS